VRYAGDKQPNSMPIPDAAYFYHGRCVASSVADNIDPSTSAPSVSAAPSVSSVPSQSDLPSAAPSSPSTSRRKLFAGRTAVVTSHSCLLNLCLGGGGFDCIGVYSGTAFAFDADVFKFDSTDDQINREPKLPPPYVGTIIGGTGAFEGIEGYVDVATIAGTTGPLTVSTQSFVKIGFIVQTIIVHSNMALPSAP